MKMSSAKPNLSYIRVLVLLNSIALAGTLVVNALANAVPVNGMTTGEISNAYPNLFVPAGLTFTIWGIIYLQLLGFSIYAMTMLFSQSSSQDGRLAFVRQIGPWFLMSCLANMTWIIACHYLHVGLALALMFVLLVSLIAIYQRLRIGRIVRPTEKFFVHLPFSVYLGWISVATVANVTALLIDRGWTGGPLSESLWACIMIIVAVGLGAIMLKKRADYGYALVIIWACLGIFIKRFGQDEPSWNMVTIAALAGIGILLAHILVVVTRKT